MYVNSCRKLLRLQRTACYGFQCGSLLASVHKLSHITECHSLLLLLTQTTSPPSLPTSLPHLTFSPSADLCGEKRGDWRFLPTEQRQEARLGPHDVSARNMMAAHFSLTLSLIKKKFTTMEEYSGVFTEHLTDHQPLIAHPLQKKWQRF